MKRYRPTYNIPARGVLANPVPSREINPVEARAVYDLIWIFIERLEAEADARNIAAQRLRSMVGAGLESPGEVRRELRGKLRRRGLRKNEFAGLRNPRGHK